MILEKFRYGFLSRVRRPEGVAPKVHQNVKKRLGANPSVVFEVSLAGALVLMVCAFKFFPDIEPPKMKIQVTQEFVKFEDVEHTRQEVRPPAPPRPLIPIEAPGDEVLDDAPIFDSEIDFAADVPPPPPPSPESDDPYASYFVAVEEMPQIIGGIEAIMRNLVYPELAVRAGVQGRVYVLAFVNTEGEVVRAEVQKGIGAGCDEAAVAAVMKARFIPGKQRGKPVNVRVSIPIRFALHSN